MDNEREVATKEIVERQMKFLALWHSRETCDIAEGKAAARGWSPLAVLDQFSPFKRV